MEVSGPRHLIASLLLRILQHFYLSSFVCFSEFLDTWSSRIKHREISLIISPQWVHFSSALQNDAQYFFKDDTLINVARFCFGLNMFTTLPLELFVCREVRCSSGRGGRFGWYISYQLGHRAIFLRTWRIRPPSTRNFDDRYIVQFDDLCVTAMAIDNSLTIHYSIHDDMRSWNHARNNWGGLGDSIRLHISGDLLPPVN